LNILIALILILSKLGTNFKLEPAIAPAKFTRKIAERASATSTLLSTVKTDER
jgi:hypothetical protein